MPLPTTTTAAEGAASYWERRATGLNRDLTDGWRNVPWLICRDAVILDPRDWTGCAEARLIRKIRDLNLMRRDCPRDHDVQDEFECLRDLRAAVDEMIATRAAIMAGAQ
jgi:hypothetical protein